MLIKPFIKADWTKQVVEGVIGGISVADNGLIYSDFNLQEVCLFSHHPLPSCSNTLSWTK